MDTGCDPNSPSWSTSFKRGVEFFRQSKYDEALEMFDEGIRLNNNEKTIFDSRAAVLEKLGRIADALRDSKRFIDLAPTSWQGYARSARLFLKLNKFAAATKMVDLALERVKSSDHKRRDELQNLKRQVTDRWELQVKRMSRKAYHFGKLPFEVGSIIFLMVTEGDIALATSLSRVCQHWRSIALNTPALWRCLILSAKTSKKADVWLGRSKGIAKELHIRSNFNFVDRPNLLQSARKTFWADLEILKIDISPHNRSLDAALVPGAFKKLRLKRLELISTPSAMSYASEAQFWTALDSLEINSIEYLVSEYAALPWERLSLFKSLRTLIIRASLPFLTDNPGHFLSALRTNPLLETLILDIKTPTLLRVESPLPLYTADMHFLNHLELIGQGVDIMQILSLTSLPKVTFLRIGRTYDAERIFPLLQNSVAPNLTELRLTAFFSSGAALLGMLQCTPKLVTLEISHIGEIYNEVMDALAGRSRTGAALICPMLQHVDFSNNERMRSSSIVHLVKAHLPSADRGSGPTDLGPAEDVAGEVDGVNGDTFCQPVPAPIRTLVINGCPLIDPDILPWLRANVERVSCLYTTKKKGRH